MMRNNAEKEGAVFSSPNDNRITPFGKFMRKTRIDEFPQFVNILKGEMAVIGPRPERPFFVKEIAENHAFLRNATRNKTRTYGMGTSQLFLW